MRSCYKWLNKSATGTSLSSAAKIFPRTVAYPATSTGSPLRYYSALQPRNGDSKNKKNRSLTGQNPARDLSVSSVFAGGAWAFAGLLTCHRMVEWFDGDSFFDSNYSHPWAGALFVAALINLAVEMKDEYDTHANFTCAILSAKANSNDDKALLYLFKTYLIEHTASDEIFALAFCAKKTGTLDILLDAAKQMKPHYSAELFAAVVEHGSKEFRAYTFQMAKEKGLWFDNKPDSHNSHEMRPRR